MVHFVADEVRKFSLELRNPDKLLRGCEHFHQIEPRDIVYIVSRKIILDNPDSEYNVLAGIEILLLNWNAVYLSKKPKEVKENLEEEILDAYRLSKNDFKLLRNEKLEKIDLEDPDIVGKLKRIFNIFSDQQSIGVTGASKAIHLINPELLMMWDNEIRTNYHRLHPFYRVNSKTRDECYVEFMKNMQKTARSILQKKSIEVISQKHLSHSRELRTRANAFPQAAIETLPKMLDECNFVKFRRGLDF